MYAHFEFKMFTFALILMITTSTSTMSQNLIGDGQKVLIDCTTGWAGSTQGSRGLGKFRNVLNAKAGTFGPANVITHTATELRFRGKRDDCTLKPNGRMNCKSGSKCAWR